MRVGKKHAATKQMLIFTYSRIEQKHSKKGKQNVQITGICSDKRCKKIQRADKYNFNVKTKKSHFYDFDQSFSTFD